MDGGGQQTCCMYVGAHWSAAGSNVTLSSEVRTHNSWVLMGRSCPWNKHECRYVSNRKSPALRKACSLQLARPTPPCPPLQKALGVCLQSSAWTPPQLAVRGVVSPPPDCEHPGESFLSRSAPLLLSPCPSAPA